MTSLSEYLTQAAPADPIVLQADARRLRGEETRQMAAALGRRIAAAIAGLAGRRSAGRLIASGRFGLAP